MYTMAQPWLRSSLTMRNISSISALERAEEGSSITSTLALMRRALAISTICCRPTGRSPTMVSGSRSWMPSLASCSTACRFISAVSRRPPLTISRPRNMLLATVRCWHMFSSWWMMATPSSWACLVFRSPSTLCPKMVMSPESRVYTPERIFIRVDLPAPFSPSSAMTSPVLRWSCTSSRAFTPGKVLVTCSMTTAYSLMF